MKKYFRVEIIVSIFLTLTLLTFLQGPELLMPMTFNSMFLVLFVIFFLVFAGLIYKEDQKDERENLHKLEAGRVAYLAGVSVLTLGIVVQSLSHNINPWLIYSLIVMIIVKLAARIYFQIKH